ncbi:MAG: hypothetical protein ACI8T1_000745 [Verrucomicrobiales bacterium]|jgi:uncharacterized protein YlxP (DUF503 family)
MADTFGTRLKRAFKWHWNLLFLGAGAAVGLLSDSPDVILPALAAGELAYLGFLGLNDRFQNVLRGKRIIKEQEDQMRVHRLVNFLSVEDRRRFENLQKQCKELTQLQKRLDTQRHDEANATFRTESLDKLLWLFLKLLYQKSGVERFLAQTDRRELGDQLDTAEHQVAEATDHGKSERLISSLQEKRAILKSRVANYDQAQENFDVLSAEIDNTEQKIVHLCEVGMTNRDPSNLSHQIDGIADSVSLSEKALQDLNIDQYMPDDTPPPLISEETTSGMSLVEMG